MASTINGTSTGNGGLISTGDDSGILNIQTNETTAITVNASQNVGIGTTSPVVKLNVVGSNNANNAGVAGGSYGIRFENGVTYSLTGSAISGVDNTFTTSFQPLTVNGSQLGFAISGTERMRIDSGGNVQIRTTTNPNGIKFRVKGENGDEFELDNDGSQFTSSYLSNNGTIKVSSYWDNTNAKYQIVAVSNGVYLASGGVAWIAVSDERKKDIIEPITNATSKVNQLRAVIGKYKTDADGTRRSFLIAQDVQSVFPEAVDATNPDELGLSYSDTIPLLVAAIKEQQATITAQAETLTQQTEAINALTARIVALETA